MKKLILSFSLLFIGMVGYAQKYITYELTDGLGNKKPYKFELQLWTTPDSCQPSVKSELTTAYYKFKSDYLLFRADIYSNSLQYTPNDSNVVGTITRYSNEDEVFGGSILVTINYKIQNRNTGNYVMTSYLYVGEKGCGWEVKEKENKKKQIEEEIKKNQIREEEIKKNNREGAGNILKFMAIIVGLPIAITYLFTD